jgi:hypothetical protein
MRKQKPLPSIPRSKIKSISTPAADRVIEIRSSVVLEPSLNGSRIRGWRSPDIEEQHKLYLQSKQEETFWKIRMRNRP